MKEWDEDGNAGVHFSYAILYTTLKYICKFQVRSYSYLDSYLLWLDAVKPHKFSTAISPFRPLHASTLGLNPRFLLGLVHAHGAYQPMKLH